MGTSKTDSGAIRASESFRKGVAGWLEAAVPACIVLVASCCGGQQGASMDPVEPIEPVSGEAGPSALFELVLPSGSQPLPDGSKAMEQTFAEAVALYERAAYMPAAERFLAAAAHIFPGGGFYRDGLAGARMIAYRNAALSWRMADDLAAVRTHLGRRAEIDLACAEELRALLDELPDQ